MRIYKTIKVVFLLVAVFSIVFIYRSYQTSNSADSQGQVLGVMESLENANNLPVSPVLTPPAKTTLEAEPAISAQRAVVMDSDTESVLFGKNIDEEQTIASLTKLITALVFFENKPDWASYYKIQRSDMREGGNNYIFAGDEIKLIDLFNLALIPSENTAAVSLAHALGFTEDQFAQKMNEKMRFWKLDKTRFSDCTGLGLNYSTAKEIALLAKRALSYNMIREATQNQEYEFTVKDGAKRVAKSTNKLLEVYPRQGVDLAGGKTGHTNLAGYCFAGIFFKQDNKEVVSVVLNDKSDAARFATTQTIVNWSYNNHTWK